MYDKISHLTLSVQIKNQDVGNIELCELLETEPKTQWKACLSYCNIGMVYCTCGHVLHKEKERFIGNPYHVRWTFFQSLSMSSRREDFMDTDMGKGQETKNIIWLTNWRRNAKREIQGNHDRLLQDQECRIRMIENHRDEEVCRRWDALADEDDTHHLIVQEYFHSKKSWCKQGSNSMPLRHRSGFKQALSTLQQLQQEAGDELHVPTYSNKPQQWEAQCSSSTWWDWQCSRSEPSIEWTERPVSCNFWQESSKMTFTNSIYFVTVGSFTADRRVV